MINAQTPGRNGAPAALAMQPVDGGELQQVEGGIWPAVVVFLEYAGAAALGAGVGFTAARLYYHFKDQ